MANRMLLLLPYVRSDEYRNGNVADVDGCRPQESILKSALRSVHLLWKCIARNTAMTSEMIGRIRTVQEVCLRLAQSTE
jgi:hypothetical protein